MLFNLTDILSKEDKTETLSVNYEATHFKCHGGQFKVLKPGPVELQFTNIGKGKARVTGTGCLEFFTRCDRCLSNVTTPVELSIDEEVLEEHINNPTDVDEYPFLDGYQLDTEVLIHNEILINWPGKILCKEDCKGICKKCGKDLNHGDCGCDSFVPDPRMAVIKDIFNANKEV